MVEGGILAVMTLTSMQTIRIFASKWEPVQPHVPSIIPSSDNKGPPGVTRRSRGLNSATNVPPKGSQLGPRRLQREILEMILKATIAAPYKAWPERDRGKQRILIL